MRCRITSFIPTPAAKAAFALFTASFLAACPLPGPDPGCGLVPAASSVAAAAEKKQPKKAPKKIVYKTIEDDAPIYKRGIAYYENAEYERAIETFSRITEKNPDSFHYDMALYLVGESFRKQGRADDAITWYARLIKQCPKSRLAPEALHSIAEIYRRKGVSGEALKYYGHLVELYPDSFWAEEARAFVKFNKTGTDADAAIKAADESKMAALKAGTPAGGTAPKSPGASSGPPKLADLDGIAGIDKAIRDTVAAGGKNYEPVDYRDEDLEAYREALDAHEKNDFERAKSRYQKLILKYKNSVWYPNAFYMLGNCYLATGDPKAAARFYSAALIYCRESGLMREIMRNLADLLFTDGQHVLALRYYENLAMDDGKASPAELMQYYFMIGECNTRLGNHALAAKAYAKVAFDISAGVSPEKAVEKIVSKKQKRLPELPPPVPPAETEAVSLNQNPLATLEVPVRKKEEYELRNRINEGISHFNDGEYLKAVSKFEQAMVLRQDEPDALWYLALCHQQLEKYQKAADYMQKYVTAFDGSKNEKPPHPLSEAHSILAYLFVRQNLFDSARAEYLKIIGIEPGSKSAAAAHDALRRIEVMKKRASEADALERRERRESHGGPGADAAKTENEE